VNDYDSLVVQAFIHVRFASLTVQAV